MVDNSAGVEGRAPTQDSQALHSAGLDLSAIDRAAEPGDDFFRYANGTWLDRTTLPDGEARITAFSELAARTEAQLRGLVEAAATTPAPTGHPAQRIGDFYAAYMDVDAINARGMAPLAGLQSSIDAIDSVPGAARWLAAPRGLSKTPLALTVEVDERDPHQHAVYLSQSGLGLPTPAHYTGKGFAAARAAYRTYLVQMLTFAGHTGPGEAADAVLRFETRLAEGYWPAERSNQPSLTNNPYTAEELESLLSPFPIRQVLAAAGLGTADSIVLREDTALVHAAQILGEEEVSTLQAYFTAHLTGAFAPVLPGPVREAEARFRRSVNGTDGAERPREVRALAAVNDTLGEVLGSLYVRAYFTPDTKAAAEDMVSMLTEAFAQRLAAASWMTAEAKAAATAKLERLTAKIGYPEKGPAQDAPLVRRDDAFGNLARARFAEHERMIARLNTPVTGEAWPVLPHRPTAYYSPRDNEIVLPAAMLQPPFFDPEADPAANYGAIGAIIGHEIGHGFDAEGSQSDGDGIVAPWWERADRKGFATLTAALRSQIDDDAPFDADRTMAETVGDLGGLSLALAAYRLSLDSEPAPVIAGLTGEQRFFLAWAQMWRAKATDDPPGRPFHRDRHAPAAFRANGIVRNMDDWYDAFSVSAEDDLYLAPGDRVTIW